VSLGQDSAQDNAQDELALDNTDYKNLEFTSQRIFRREGIEKLAWPAKHMEQLIEAGRMAMTHPKRSRKP